MEWRNADEGFRVESNLEELEVKIEFFVATEKITDHGVGRMRTQIKKSLDSGHSVGERACLEARKTESAPIGSLKKNLFPKIVVGGHMYFRGNFLLIYGNHYKCNLLSPNNNKNDVAIFSIDL